MEVQRVEADSMAELFVILQKMEAEGKTICVMVKMTKKRWKVFFEE